MAAKWQQWMPFHIDRFRGSPDVQAMHPVARIGYLYLLASAWQTDDCSISADDLDLSSLSGLGDELWSQYKARILRKFATREDGRLFNQVLFDEWLGAKRIFEARSASARKTTETRSPYADRHAPPTQEQRQRQKLLQSPLAEVPAGVFELPLPGNQGEWSVPHKLFDELVNLYPNVSIIEELAKMRGWLLTNPRKTAKGLPRFVNNWLSKAQNSPTGGSNGTIGANRSQQRTTGNLAAFADFNTGEGDRHELAIAGRSQTERAIDPVTPSMVAQGVLDGCSLSGNSLFDAIKKVAAAESRRAGYDPAALKSKMIETWREFEAAGPKLTRFAPRPVQFFGEGHWRNKSSWGWREGMEPTPRVYITTASDKVKAQIAASQ
jgi:uncharacterized protein YdaU (DUF1376 family)